MLYPLVVQSHAPGVIRTHNLLIRSQMLYPIELRVRKDRQANAKVREVKQTGSRKTMLRDWYLWASTLLLQQKRAQSLTRSRSQLQWLAASLLFPILHTPFH